MSALLPCPTFASSSSSDEARLPGPPLPAWPRMVPGGPAIAFLAQSRGSRGSRARYLQGEQRLISSCRRASSSTSSFAAEKSDLLPVNRFALAPPRCRLEAGLSNRRFCLPPPFCSRQPFTFPSLAAPAEEEA